MGTSKRGKHPELPNCEPRELRYKDSPTVNEDGQEMSRCKVCDGSGAICSGEKKVLDKQGAAHPVFANFTGNERAKYQRQGYAITCVRCTSCAGAGLLVGGPTQ